MVSTGSRAVYSAGQSGVNVSGLVAAGVWAVGLIAGLAFLLAGHEVVAAATLVVAVMSPWIGLAVISRSEIPEDASVLSSHGRPAVEVAAH